VRDAEFPVVMRGYDRVAVDAFLAELADRIDALESRQTRDAVVRRALEDVGEQTAAILMQAHESSDDITARSRSQAEDRLERVREEAAAITREAEDHAAQVERETLALREDRENLIEDLRRLATEALTITEEAAERLEAPAPDRPIVAPEEESLDGPFDDTDELEPLEEWTSQEPAGDDATRELTALPEERATGERADEEPTTDERAAGERATGERADEEPPRATG